MYTLEGGIDITSSEDCSGLLNHNVTSVVTEFDNCYYSSSLMITNYHYLQFIDFGVYSFNDVEYLHISNNSALKSIRFLDNNHSHYDRQMEVEIRGKKWHCLVKRSSRANYTLYWKSSAKLYATTHLIKFILIDGLTKIFLIWRQ